MLNLICTISIFVASLGMFSVAPVFSAATPATFRFAVMGCMHFGYCNKEDYKTAITEIKRYKPDFVLFLGGMVDTIGVDSSANEVGYNRIRNAIAKNIALSPEALEKEWQEFDTITRELGVPVYDIPSESSIPPHNSTEAEKLFLTRYHNRYYSFEHKNNLFILLDSESHNNLDLKKRGFIERGQLEFLKKTLARSSGYTNVFVAMHKAVWLPGLRDDSNWYSVVHPLLHQSQKVKYIFGACLHALTSLEIDGINYISSGAAPCRLNQEYSPSFFHFLIVEVTGGDISVKVIPLGAIPLKNLLKTASRKVIHESLDRIQQPERKDVLQPAKVVAAFDIRPGMQIADIGAGSGIYAFPIAEALKHTGTVFATDVDPEAITFLSQQATEKKYDNLKPVLVSPKGVAPFYLQHTFDIILLSNVYSYIENPARFFAELRPSLKKNTGRLYIIHFRDDSDFSSIEFEDFQRIAALLARNPRSPLLQSNAALQKYLTSRQQQEPVTPDRQEEIIAHLNNLLTDRRLFLKLQTYYCTEKGIPQPAILGRILFPHDIRLAQFLIADLGAENVFDKPEALLTPEQIKKIRRLNRILITGILKTQKLHTLFGLDSPVRPDKKQIVATLEKAGYTFLRGLTLLTHHYIFEFKREN